MVALIGCGLILAGCTYHAWKQHHLTKQLGDLTARHRALTHKRHP